MKKFSRNISFYNFFFIISIFSHIFMWDYDYLYLYEVADINILNPKILILFFFFYHLINFYPFIAKNFNVILKKNKVLIIFTLLLAFHLILNTYNEIFFINKLLKFSLFIFIWFFCFNFYALIKNNLKFTIYFFLLVNFFIILLNFFLSIINSNEIFHLSNYIFKERSHYAMMMAPVIIFLFVSIRKNFSYLTFALLISIFFSSLLYYSTTLFLGIIIINIFFSFFFFKNFKKKIFIVLLMFLTFFLGSQCRFYYAKKNSLQIFSLSNDTKLNYIYDLSNDTKLNYIDDTILINTSQKLKNKLQNEWAQEKKKNISIREFFLKKDLSELPIFFHGKTGDLSLEVMINSLKIAYYSFLDNKFLGNGLNNYENAFAKHMLNEITPAYYEVYFLNYNDGSNNFSKILVEFGLFSLFYFYIFMRYTFCNKVPLNFKMFFISIILIQLIRGAGYTNGGFMFSIAIMFSHLSMYNRLLPFKKF
jgi:hypothetical protein